MTTETALPKRQYCSLLGFLERISPACQPHTSLLDTRSRRFPFRWSLLSLLVFYRSELSHSFTRQLLGSEACHTFITFAFTIWKVQRTPSLAERTRPVVRSQRDRSTNLIFSLRCVRVSDDGVWCARTQAGDPQELNTIAEMFCKGRDVPLLIGSVKSNMGHAEPASGLCSIAKVLVAMETGLIPPNLHFEQPNPDVPALLEGRIQVVTKPLEWEGGLVSVNSFGFGGANGHAILRSYPKPKFPAPRDDFPRLVAVSGRTEEAVDAVLAKLESMPRDDELLSLIHGIHARNIPGHHYRGYTILGPDSGVKEMTEVVADKRPVWFVFSGMGSQWAGMARRLMDLKVFEKSIRRCAEVLKPLDVDLLHSLTKGDDETFRNVTNAFVGIVSVQVSCSLLLRVACVRSIVVPSHLKHFHHSRAVRRLSPLVGDT
ncbi:hypothetical protein PR048_010561 [Dryococelus australis]|uniref:Ketosynthase family 3 (KS3) domain-containing protein n=1 Tax=Dryococelus australis TaxID=614101 RepID=A0ABQ9I3I8_9NEOP|nr:hypothetical protein PR048_010561 [Dryococelus australis]